MVQLIPNNKTRQHSSFQFLSPNTSSNLIYSAKYVFHPLNATNGKKDDWFYLILQGV